MPKGLARKEPTGLWRVGATAAEQVEAARLWAGQLVDEATVLPPFHGEEPVSAHH